MKFNFGTNTLLGPFSWLLKAYPNYFNVHDEEITKIYDDSNKAVNEFIHDEGFNGFVLEKKESSSIEKNNKVKSYNKFLNPLTLSKAYDFALKAYGANCGEIVDGDLSHLRPKSWHWIKSNIDVTELKKRFNTLDYSMSRDTVRQDSLGQKELIHLYSI